MTVQDDYDAHHGGTNAHCYDFLYSHRLNYAALVTAGADSALLAKYHHGYKALVNVAKVVCDLANDCAASVPNVVVASGGGPKDDDDITSGP